MPDALQFWGLIIFWVVFGGVMIRQAIVRERERRSLEDELLERRRDMLRIDVYGEVHTTLTGETSARFLERCAADLRAQEATKR